jgi:hypothetical protein
MLAGPLTIAEQSAAMRAAWPRFSAHILPGRGDTVRWIGTARPQFAAYRIEIRYRLFDDPEVRVIEPELKRLPGNEEGQLPHVYPPADDPTLCLFDPKASQWNPSMAIAETTVPWAVDWLACYELWLMTGKWPGGGRHPVEEQVQLLLTRGSQ